MARFLRVTVWARAVWACGTVVRWRPAVPGVSVGSLHDLSGLLPSVIASRYIPVRLIGKGGVGAVYEVEHARTGERLALKVLHGGVTSSPEALERFKREARASARINSQHVVRVIDADVAPELEGAPFLVMELLEGEDFQRMGAAAAEPFPPAMVVAWLRQVARALDKAHHLGIVHRDLKPENLFLARSEGGPAVVKILDFGLVKMMEEGPGATGSGQILGTPRYMAPEQASAGTSATPATDRCALGLVAFRLLVGEDHYKGGAMSILTQLLHGELQRPTDRGARFGEAFDAWFLKACHRQPEQRFSSAAEQIEALAAALDLSTDAVEPTRAPTIRASSAHRRRPLALAGGIGLTAVAIVGVTLAVTTTRRRGQNPAQPAPAVAPALTRAAPAAPPPEPVTPAPDPPMPRVALGSPLERAARADGGSSREWPAERSSRSRAWRRASAATEALKRAAANPAPDQPKVPDPYADQK